MTQAQGPFTQLPYSLWTYPGLSIHERWLAATIIRLCWKPGPQPFSYQRLAKEAGLSTGALCTKGKDDQAREGMIPHLEREGLVKVYRPVNEEGQVIRGKAFLIEPTEKLWQMNTSCSRSVYPVNTQPSPVNTTVYDVNTPVYGVNTPVYDVNTEEGITSSQKRVEEAPYIKIDSIDSLDKKIEDSFVVSALAENDAAGLSFLSSLSSFEETLEEVQQQEDLVIVDHLPDGQQVIRRTSGRPLGELIPVGTDIQEAIRDLISVEGSIEENGQAPLSFPPNAAQEEPTEEEVARRETEPLTHTISIPVLLSQEDKRKTPSQEKTGEKGKHQKCLSIKECSPEIQARRRKWQAHFNERRGGDLLALKKDRINESAGIASLVDTYTDAQITALDHHLYAVDDFWSKPAKRREVNGERVWQKASMTRERLKELGHWPGSTGTYEDATTFKEDQFSCIPKGYNAADEFRQYYGINEPREVSHATV